MTFFVENETDVIFDFDIQEIVEMVGVEILDSQECPYEAEVNLLITDNSGIQVYNQEMRGIDRPTDVLSFPNIEFESPADFSLVEDCIVEYFEPDTGELIMGDIIISKDKVKEQALNYGHSEKREFAFLVAHSMLHLCGYDHMEENEAKIMEALQTEALDKLGIKRE